MSINKIDTSAAGVVSALLDGATPDQKRSLTPKSTVDDAAIVQINTAAFSGKLEKHIDDYYKGHPELSHGIDSQLEARNTKNDVVLSNYFPKALSNYNAYSTAFNYGNRSRFVSNIHDALNSLSTILPHLKK